jgi:hypothetical protein
MMRMNARFNPRATTQRAKRLAFGTLRGPPGLVPTWSGIDLSNDYQGQLELAQQAIRLVGVDIALRVMHASAATLFAGELKSEEIEFFCHRVAANLNVLTADTPLTSWKGLLRPLVAPLQIVYAETGWSRAKEPKPGTTLTFRIIDGIACPLQFSRWFPQRFLWVLGREIGIVKWRSKNPFVGNRAQLHGMRFVATLLNSKYEPGTMTFDRYAPGQFRGHNHELMRLRGEVCPAGYGRHCYKCSIGEDKCPVAGRACRPRTLVLSSCALCGGQTYHDGSECIPCRKRPPSACSGG